MVDEEGCDGPDEEDREAEADCGACALPESVGEGPGVAMCEEVEVDGGGYDHHDQCQCL